MPTKKRKSLNKYQRLVKAKSRYCKGKTTKAALNKLATTYVNDAVKKGKTKTEAKRIANKVVNGACKVSGTKKKTTRRKKRTTRRRSRA